MALTSSHLGMFWRLQRSYVGSTCLQNVTKQCDRNSSVHTKTCQTTAPCLAKVLLCSLRQVQRRCSDPLCLVLVIGLLKGAFAMHLPRICNICLFISVWQSCRSCLLMSCPAARNCRGSSGWAEQSPNINTREHAGWSSQDMLARSCTYG